MNLEQIQANTKQSLKKIDGLTEQQLSTIETILNNHEDQVIKTKVREIHSLYDADIKDITGQEKPAGGKTYDHLKTVLSDLQSKAQKAGQAKQLADQVAQLKQEKEDLLKAKSTDPVMKQKIETLQGKINDKDSQIESLKNTWEQERQSLVAAKNEQQEKLLQYQVTNSFDSYLQEKKAAFNPAIGEAALQDLLSSRKAKVLSQAKEQGFTPSLDDKGKFVFKNEAGAIWRNPDNNSEPFTPGELLYNSIGDLLKKDATGGAGTKGGQGGAAPSVASLSSAKTQVEADTIITDYLLAQGLTKTSEQWQPKFQEIRESSSVSDLPLR